MKFHSAMGFVISGAYQNSMYKFGQWRDVIWMAKSLRPHEIAPVPTVPFPLILQEAQTEAVLLAQAQTVHVPALEKREGKHGDEEKTG